MQLTYIFETPIQDMRVCAIAFELSIFIGTDEDVKPPAGVRTSGERTLQPGSYGKDQKRCRLLPSYLHSVQSKGHRPHGNLQSGRHHRCNLPTHLLLW